MYNLFSNSLLIIIFFIIFASKVIAMSTLELKVYEIFKTKFSEQEAATVIEYFESKTEDKIQQKKDIFLTKDDKVDIMRSIYFVGLVQFLAIVGSVLAIAMFVVKK